MGLMKTLSLPSTSEHSSRNFCLKRGKCQRSSNQGWLWHQTSETSLAVNSRAYRQNEVNALKENGSQFHDEILHEHQIKSSVKMQSQDIQINPVQSNDNSFIMQSKRKRSICLEALDAGLVVTESSGTESHKQDTISSSGN
ncbi:hypothetical protein Tco_1175519 [Tanacetum coccineum]